MAGERLRLALASRHTKSYLERSSRPTKANGPSYEESLAHFHRLFRNIYGAPLIYDSSEKEVTGIGQAYLRLNGQSTLWSFHENPQIFRDHVSVLASDFPDARGKDPFQAIYRTVRKGRGVFDRVTQADQQILQAKEQTRALLSGTQEGVDRPLDIAALSLPQARKLLSQVNMCTWDIQTAARTLEQSCITLGRHASDVTFRRFPSTDGSSYPNLVQVFVPQNHNNPNDTSAGEVFDDLHNAFGAALTQRIALQVPSAEALGEKAAAAWEVIEARYQEEVSPQVLTALRKTLKVGKPNATLVHVLRLQNVMDQSQRLYDTYAQEVFGAKNPSIENVQLLLSAARNTLSARVQIHNLLAPVGSLLEQGEIAKQASRRSVQSALAGANKRVRDIVGQFTNII